MALALLSSCCIFLYLTKYFTVKKATGILVHVRVFGGYGFITPSQETRDEIQIPLGTMIFMHRVGSIVPFSLLSRKDLSSLDGRGGQRRDEGPKCTRPLAARANGIKQLSLAQGQRVEFELHQDIETVRYY